MSTLFGTISSPKHSLTLSVQILFGETDGESRAETSSRVLGRGKGGPRGFRRQCEAMSLFGESMAGVVCDFGRPRGGARGVSINCSKCRPDSKSASRDSDRGNRLLVRWYDEDGLPFAVSDNLGCDGRRAFSGERSNVRHDSVCLWPEVSLREVPDKGRGIAVDSLRPSGAILAGVGGGGR